MHNRLGHRFSRRLDVPNWLEPKTPGAEWSPLDIPGLLAWYAARLETAYSDTDAVPTWTDQSGNGRHATQGVGGEQPVFNTGIINGLPVIRMTPVDNLEANAIGALLSGDDVPFSIYFVADLCAAANFTYFWSLGNSGNNTPWHAYRSRIGVGFSSTRDDDAGANSILSPPADNYDELWHIHGLRYTGGLGTEGRLDGAQAFTGNQTGGVMTVDRFTIGCLGRITDGGEHVTADFPEMVICDSAISDDDQDRLEAYLNGFYAIY